jgi:hypothetical protein
MNTMPSFRAHVRDGRLILDAPTDLPEGKEIELVAAADDLSGMTEDERRQLAVEIAAAQADADAGLGVDIEEVLKQLGPS